MNKHLLFYTIIFSIILLSCSRDGDTIDTAVDVSDDAIGLYLTENNDESIYGVYSGVMYEPNGKFEIVIREKDSFVKVTTLSDNKEYTLISDKLLTGSDIEGDIDLIEFKGDFGGSEAKLNFSVSEKGREPLISSVSFPGFALTFVIVDKEKTEGVYKNYIAKREIKGDQDNPETVTIDETYLISVNNDLITTKKIIKDLTVEDCSNGSCYKILYGNGEIVKFDEGEKLYFKHDLYKSYVELFFKPKNEASADLVTVNSWNNGYRDHLTYLLNFFLATVGEVESGDRLEFIDLFEKVYEGLLEQSNILEPVTYVDFKKVGDARVILTNLYFSEEFIEAAKKQGVFNLNFNGVYDDDESFAENLKRTFQKLSYYKENAKILKILDDNTLRLDSVALDTFIEHKISN